MREKNGALGSNVTKPRSPNPSQSFKDRINVVVVFNFQGAEYFSPPNHGPEDPQPVGTWKYHMDTLVHMMADMHELFPRFRFHDMFSAGAPTPFPWLKAVACVSRMQCSCDCAPLQLLDPCVWICLISQTKPKTFVSTLRICQACWWRHCRWSQNITWTT